MERYNLAILTKKIYDSNLLFFSLKTLRDILNIKKEVTLFSIIRKLLEAEVLMKVEKDRYLLKGAEINDFALANFIYSASYISFESALNFYGILSQFPYEITSATTKKTIKKIFQKKIYIFTHIKKDLFFGYEKKNDFIIAFPEKALLDQLYISSKGYKKVNIDEYDLTKLNITRFKNYLERYPKTKQFQKSINVLKKYINI
jgi:predicted transcriptional regulator of viral defense system